MTFFLVKAGAFRQVEIYKLAAVPQVGSPVVFYAFPLPPPGR